MLFAKRSIQLFSIVAIAAMSIAAQAQEVPSDVESGPVAESPKKVEAVATPTTPTTDPANNTGKYITGGYRSVEAKNLGANKQEGTLGAKAHVLILSKAKEGSFTGLVNAELQGNIGFGSKSTAFDGLGRLAAGLGGNCVPNGDGSCRALLVLSGQGEIQKHSLLAGKDRLNLVDQSRDGHELSFGVEPTFVFFDGFALAPVVRYNKGSKGTGETNGLSGGVRGVLSLDDRLYVVAEYLKTLSGTSGGGNETRFRSQADLRLGGPFSIGGQLDITKITDIADIKPVTGQSLQSTGTVKVLQGYGALRF